MARAPPIIDFSAALSDDSDGQSQLVENIRQACQDFGFFQLVNHGVPRKLQEDIMSQAAELFDLPLDVKEKYSKDIGGFRRGYERLRDQKFDKKTEGDLKEGYYLGKDLPEDDPNVVARKFGQGPNKYPTEVSNPSLFKEVVDTYHAALSELAGKILRILALGLGLEPDWFSEFATAPVAALRLLHYPPHPPDPAQIERGAGAHTDFGAITILLQDMNGGLQIWDRDISQWVDVVPVEGAYVVNLGNMMMRWTNDKYLSNLHQVINKSGKERYSIPFFFSGNPDFMIECLPSCKDDKLGAKYSPITVDQWMTGRYADTYGTETGPSMEDLVAKNAASAMVSS